MKVEDIDPARRRLEFYRMASEMVLDGCPQGMAEHLLLSVQQSYPRNDPCWAWSEDDIEDIVRRVYAVHRQRKADAALVAEDGSP